MTKCHKISGEYVYRNLSFKKSNDISRLWLLKIFQPGIDYA